MSKGKQRERVKSRKKNVTAATPRHIKKRRRKKKKGEKINTGWKNMERICLSRETNGAQGERLRFTAPQITAKGNVFLLF